MTPGAPRRPEPVPKPGVIVGDEVYCHHPKGAHAGRVIAHGKHGVTLEGGHRVRWEHVLGHKRRAGQEFTVVDEGEDGCIVQDKNGLRQFVAVPPEAREEQMVVKAGMGQRLALFTKAEGGTPYMGRPGLTKKVITDKRGVQTTRWVRTTPEDAHPLVGHHVGWQNGDVRAHGRVASVGKDGAMVHDQSGGVHAVRHEHITHHWRDKAPPDRSPHEAPDRPGYAPRQDGETDKAYAKRAVDTGDAVHDLPEDHGRYFHTEGAATVGIDKLHSTKTDDENQQGGDNGAKRMLAAYHGVLGKRAPITVMPHATKPGHHEVVDGNGTLTSAKRLGWKSLPVNHVSREQGEAMMAADKAREAAKAATAAMPAGKRFFDPKEVEALPSSKTWRHTAFKSWEEAEAKGPESLEQYTKILSDLAKSLGFKQGPAGGPDRMTDEHIENGDSYLFMGPLKKKEKADGKVRTDYAGDWSKLKDYVRATIAVRSVDDVHKAIGALKASGLKLAQAPKDNMTAGTADGYRDINMVVLLPNGMPAELQLQVKRITKAKAAAHGLYNENVALEQKNKEAGHEDISQWPPGDRQKFAANRSRQREIYGDAWAKVPGSDAYPDPAAGRKAARDAEAPLQKSQPSPIIIFGKRGPP